MDHVLLLLWVGILGVVIAGLLYLPRARDRCDDERERTRTEARAFGQFARRVARIDVTPVRGVQTQHASAGTVATSLAQPPDDRGLRDVREAYRETVMSVDHYEDEYDESLAANMTEEFDRDLATAVTDGGQLTPQVKRVVLECAFEARDRREEFLESLSVEADALVEAEDTLADVDETLVELNERPLIDRSYDELEEVWYQLGALSDRIETVLENRQATIHRSDGSSDRFTDPWTMYAYLYGSLPTSHPVLAEGARLLEEIQRAERRVADSLSRRV